MEDLIFSRKSQRKLHRGGCLFAGLEQSGEIFQCKMGKAFQAESILCVTTRELDLSYV